jgi:hypothetical protein
VADRDVWRAHYGSDVRALTADLESRYLVSIGIDAAGPPAGAH